MYITELNTNNYNNFTKKGLVLVDIFADWCQPCKVISKLIDEISFEYKGEVAIGKLNIDNGPEIIGDLAIRNVPTLILYKNGEIVEKKVGSMSKIQIIEMIDKHIQS
jgi:thioredoxin 1